ncbi:hypothetical protein ACSR9H_04150 [Citrobacter koseri]|uniref:hypothetical protein n=1 Tax=Citrobacter koseri TaxID=545 RepID=UPI0040417D2E
MIVNKIDMDMLLEFNPLIDNNNESSSHPAESERTQTSNQTSETENIKTRDHSSDESTPRDKEKESKCRLVHSEFSWLRGKENERAIYWAWLFIMQMPVSRITDDPDETESPYNQFKLPLRTINTKARSDVIERFFELLAEKYKYECARRIYEDMLFNWTYFISSIKRIYWLKSKNEEDLDWAWNYLSKKPEFNNGSLSWLHPVNESEKRLAIVAAIDSCKLYISEYPHYFTSLEHITINNPDMLMNMNFRKALLNEMRLAYEQRKRRKINKRKGKRVAINAEISSVAKDRIVEMASVRGLQINRLIEELINNEYIDFKKQRE